MDSEKIDKLVSRYWNCETSLEDEQQLRRYFQQTDIPEHLKEAANLFRYFDSQKKSSLTQPAFDRRLMKKIKAPGRKKIATLIYNSMRIAAGIIVLFLAIWLVRVEVRKSAPSQEVADTYDDPKIAFEETKKALLMISKSFSTAEEQAKKINLFNEARKEVQKDEPKAEL